MTVYYYTFVKNSIKKESEEIDAKTIIVPDMDFRIQENLVSNIEHIYYDNGDKFVINNLCEKDKFAEIKFSKAKIFQDEDILAIKHILYQVSCNIGDFVVLDDLIYSFNKNLVNGIRIKIFSQYFSTNLFNIDLKEISENVLF